MRQQEDNLLHIDEITKEYWKSWTSTNEERKSWMHDFLNENSQDIDNLCKKTSRRRIRMI